MMIEIHQAKAEASRFVVDSALLQWLTHYEKCNKRHYISDFVKLAVYYMYHVTSET